MTIKPYDKAYYNDQMRRQGEAYKKLLEKDKAEKREHRNLVLQVIFGCIVFVLIGGLVIYGLDKAVGQNIKDAIERHDKTKKER
jgi:hypothetical protein